MFSPRVPTSVSRLLQVIGLAILATLPLVTSAQVPSSRHIYIVAEENRSYESLVGDPDMPYLNSLIARGALATQFYANRHNSITDYFLLTSGTVPTTDKETTLTFDVDNLARRFLRMGLTYKVYAQSLPYAGFPGRYSGAYMKRHTGLPYYTDMGNSQTEMLRLVPVGNLLSDVSNGNVPNFSLIVPDRYHDMHDCPDGWTVCQQKADWFLKTYIAPILARPEFQPGGDGLLIIWSDESEIVPSDNRCSATVTSGCGGRVVVAFIGPKVKAGLKSTRTYHHEHVLRTVLEAFGERASFLGLSNNVGAMTDMFASSSTSTITVSVKSPAAGATVSSPVRFVASASGPRKITSMQIYVDGVKKYTSYTAYLDKSLTLAAGTRKVTIKAWDGSGASASKSLTVTVTN